MNVSDAPDLTICDREPIHIPGRIQPHGLLLALSEPDLLILQVSANIEQQLGIAPSSLLGQPLSSLLGDHDLAYLRSVLVLDDLEQNPLYVWTVPLSPTQQQFDGVVHRHGGVLILELEPASPAASPAPDFFRLVKLAVARLQRAPTLAEFCHAASREVRALTGFDRVMIYRFDADGHGSVIAEAVAEGLEPYLGLHYPASDIPQQARALYLRNWLRLIPSVDYTPAELVPPLTPGTQSPLDLSYATLRSVSPVHLEYLSNMGVAASMSISIVHEGALWGLIACHHMTPRALPFAIRMACELLGQSVSLQLGAKYQAEMATYHAQLNDVSAQLVQAMAQDSSWRSILLNGRPNLLQFIDATGAALCIDDEIETLGQTPSHHDIRTLVDWLASGPEVEVYATASVSADLPALASCKDVASGVLAVPLAHANGDYLLWFRPEVLQTVSWGGEPTKALVPSEDGLRLSPRKSFARWQQVVGLHAQPWHAAEIAAARELRNAMLSVVLRRAAQLTRINIDLERSNNELDAFAYIASHDLKEPLRGLHNYAHFLLEDYQDRIDPDGQAKLKTMIRLTQRMDALLDSLLHYSRVGRVELAMQETNLDQLLREVLDRLTVTLKEQQVQVRIPRPLPVLRCDRVRLGEVFYNLISNAAKYSTGSQPWLEIGYHAPGEAAEGRSQAVRHYTFYVRDNGIGIAEKHFETIFRIFKRLHGREQFGGGAGVGLTIAKKIIERHSGTIWVESQLGVGTTFFFTLQGD